MADDSVPVPSAAATEPQLVGIGGWLIVSAISQGVGMLMIVYQLLNTADPVERALDAGFLVFAIVVAYSFFTKRKYLPKLMIVFLVVPVPLTLLAAIVEPTAENTRGLLFASIGAVIWIQYFLKSRRVKATFVH